MAGRLRDVQAKWAIGGDAGELIKGVHVKTDYIEVWTTKRGVDEICDLLQESVT